MADSFANSPSNRSSAPSGLFVSVSASATALANGPCRGIYIPTAGNVTITDRGGNSITFTALAVGVIHPIQATHVTAISAGGTVLVAY